MSINAVLLSVPPVNCSPSITSLSHLLGNQITKMSQPQLERIASSSLFPKDYEDQQVFTVVFISFCCYIIAIQVHFLSSPLDCKLPEHEDWVIFVCLSVDRVQMILTKCL